MLLLEQCLVGRLLWELLSTRYALGLSTGLGPRLAKLISGEELLLVLRRSLAILLLTVQFLAVARAKLSLV